MSQRDPDGIVWICCYLQAGVSEYIDLQPKPYKLTASLDPDPVLMEIMKRKRREYEEWRATPI